MEKKFLIKICMIFLCMGAIINSADAQNDGDPAVTSLSFAQSPIVVNQTTTLTLFITNGGFTTSVPAGSIGVDIILPAAGQYAAFPESLAALSGDYLSKFNWAYNSGTKTFSGVSNQDILPGDGGNIVINIRGYVVSGSTNSTANMVLLNPAAYPNDNSTNNSLVASLGVTSGVVAMNLLSFNAVKQNNTVGLKWETSSGMNSNYFDVERSANGTTWASIGTVQAVNSSVSQQYSFTDATPVKGINYYRIKQVSVTGAIEYSLIRIVNFNTKDLITILPNPTKDRVYISTASADPIRSVQVYSNEGKLLQTVPNFVSGSSIDIQNYAPGIYLLKIIYKNEKVQTEKIVKQ